MAFEWLNENSRTFLSRGYLTGDQTPEERVRVIADKAEEYLGIEGFADKFYDYMGRGFYSLASPIWSNYGLDRGLPVSCFGSYIDDNMESILYGHGENGMLMKSGGGTSGFFGAVRGRGAPISAGGESSGSVHFMNSLINWHLLYLKVQSVAVSSRLIYLLSTQTSKSSSTLVQRVTLFKV